MIQAQRLHTIRAMQDYTRLKAQAVESGPATRDEVAWLLVLEQLIFSAEAEARWLDHCEARLVRLAESLGDATGPTASAPAPATARTAKTSRQARR